MKTQVVTLSNVFGAASSKTAMPITFLYRKFQSKQTTKIVSTIIHHHQCPCLRAPSVLSPHLQVHLASAAPAHVDAPRPALINIRKLVGIGQGVVFGKGRSSSGLGSETMGAGFLRRSRTCDKRRSIIYEDSLLGGGNEDFEGSSAGGVGVEILGMGKR